MGIVGVMGGNGSCGEDKSRGNANLTVGVASYFMENVQGLFGGSIHGQL